MNGLRRLYGNGPPIVSAVIGPANERHSSLAAFRFQIRSWADLGAFNIRPRPRNLIGKLSPAPEQVNVAGSAIVICPAA
jgi:hypothetical protein